MLISKIVRQTTTFIVWAALSQGAETGKITGLIRTGFCEAWNTTIWAVTSDCRRSYRATELQGQRFTFPSIPTGEYRLVGYCYPAHSEPTGAFRVEPGATVERDPVMDYRTVDGGNGVSKGITPMNGRIVDAAGHPIEGVTVKDSFKGQESVSGSDGRFGFCGLQPGKLRLAVSHPAYRARTIKLNLGIFNYSNGQLEIKLEKKP